MQTFQRVCAHGDDVNDLSEVEYHYLLYVLCANGRYEDLKKVLEHLGSRLGAVSDSVLDTLNTGFQRGTRDADGHIRTWDMLSVSVDPKVRMASERSAFPT